MRGVLRVIVKQKFTRGKEPQCLMDLLSHTPADCNLQEDLPDAVEAILRGTEYENYFVLEVDTESRSVSVVEYE